MRAETRTAFVAIALSSKSMRPATGASKTVGGRTLPATVTKFVQAAGSTFFDRQVQFV